MLNDIKRISSQLKERLLKRMPKAGNYATPIEGVGIYRRDNIGTVECFFYTSFITVMVQGYKRSNIGSETYLYGENQCLIVGIDVPSISSILRASIKRPCMGVWVKIDRSLIAQLVSEISTPMSADVAKKALAIFDAGPDLLDAFLRLAKLFDVPDQIPVIAPMIIREIHYRLLIGPLGGHLRMINTLGTRTNQIAQAISWLRENYTKKMYVDELAQQVSMSTSTFFRDFKEVTTLSPIQYQKRLRLHEAQRLMLDENMDAANACATVGYESLTHFSREYKRLFGEPPYKNVKKIRE